MDEQRLFIAAASITVGLVAAGFSLIRGRFDRLLSFFAWFAVLYGARVWMKSDILRDLRINETSTSSRRSPSALYRRNHRGTIMAVVEEFGYERVGNVLQASAKMATEEAADLIMNTVSGWSSGQSDDLTVIICDFKHG